MTAREHAEELRQQAIKTLLEEKEAIEQALETLGYQKEAPAKRRGRPPKITSEEIEQPVSLTGRIPEVSP